MRSRCYHSLLVPTPAPENVGSEHAGVIGCDSSTDFVAYIPDFRLTSVTTWENIV